MSTPSDPPLPPWPYYLARSRHYPADEAYVVALESRLRAAVEALQSIECAIVEGRYRNESMTRETMITISEEALARIGPLPESQEGDTK
jgi:hypothetical protein